MSLPAENAERSALIDSGAVHTIIGSTTIETIMGFYGIARVEKCQPLSFVHRFGTNGTPIVPELGAITLWTAQDITGMKQEFKLRANVLEGAHLLLIGCATLIIALEASLDFSELKITATINKEWSVLPLGRIGNHIFFKSCPEFLYAKETSASHYQHPHTLSHNEIPQTKSYNFVSGRTISDP
jgi:hypothetical protein